MKLLVHMYGADPEEVDSVSYSIKGVIATLVHCAV